VDGKLSVLELNIQRVPGHARHVAKQDDLVVILKDVNPWNKSRRVASHFGLTIFIVMFLLLLF
jgi:hypothetical protein